MKTGRIIRGVGGFYDVLLPDQTIATCKARGRFRNEHAVPMVGDIVEISPQKSGYAAIETILPRKNELTRPPVSNIDRLVVVVAASAPKPDWLLVDKLMIQAHMMQIEPLLVLNKMDEANDAIFAAFHADYACFDRLAVSGESGEHIDELRTRLAGCVCCLAGQSAVGKSSILNALVPELHLETFRLSLKTERGRHTTRRAELWPFLGGALLDTPGFSFLEIDNLPQETLDAAYPEFGEAPRRCRFSNCSHISEPDCAVKPMLGQGLLTEARYQRYQTIWLEIDQRRKHRYD